MTSVPVPVRAAVREAVSSTSPVVESEGAGSRGLFERDTYEVALREGLQRVLPSALVEASGQAEETVASLAPRASAESQGALSRPGVVASLAAALGATAASAVAASLIDWLGRRAEEGVRTPAWLRPAVSHTAVPKFATLTEFSQRRTQLIREALDGTPVLLTRRGVVVAAVVPLEAGAYEDAVLPQAAQRLLQEHAEAGSTAHADVTPEGLEQLRSGVDRFATAERLGIDTRGWGALNPPRDSTDGDLEK